MVTSAGITADQVYAEALRRHPGPIGPEELSVTYDAMHTAEDRKPGGVYYTPPELADFMSRFSLENGLRQAGPAAEDVLRIIVIDPACGAGILLVQAARYLARVYTARLLGPDPHQVLVDAFMGFVIQECIFGIDIDPVAAELTRLALSLETAGAVQPADLDRNIICGNPLDGPHVSPPALEERLHPNGPDPDPAEG